MASVINTWREVRTSWDGIGSQLETASKEVLVCVCVRVCGICTCIGLWAANIFGHVCLLCSASSARLCACGAALSWASICAASVCVCICIYVRLCLWVSLYLSRSCACLMRRPCEQFAFAFQKWATNWESDPRCYTPFSLWQKLTKINFSANNCVYIWVCVCIHTWLWQRN